MQSKGRSVPNQFVITVCNPLTKGQEERIFQSYESVIVHIVPALQDRPRKVYLDSVYWNYSHTTSKYRSQFLGESTKDTEKKIKSGEYILTNLN